MVLRFWAEQDLFHRWVLIHYRQKYKGVPGDLKFTRGENEKDEAAARPRSFTWAFTSAQIARWTLGFSVCCSLPLGRSQSSASRVTHRWLYLVKQEEKLRTLVFIDKDAARQWLEYTESKQSRRFYSPKTTCLPSRKSDFAQVMKNWHPLESFPLLAWNVSMSWTYLGNILEQLLIARIFWQRRRRRIR